MGILVVKSLSGGVLLKTTILLLMKLITCHKGFLQLISVSFLRFEISKNRKVKAHSEHRNENT